MAIDFNAAKSTHEFKSVMLPEKIHRYFIDCQDVFSSYATVLDSLDEYGDTLLSEIDIKRLMEFCDEIKSITGVTADYSIYKHKSYNSWKPFDIQRDKLHRFASEFSDLLQYALDNNISVCAVGD